MADTSRDELFSEQWEDWQCHYKTYNAGTRLEYDMYHRVNGPAYVEDDEWEWYLEGNAHRYYGPAVNTGEWIIHDKGIK